MNLNIKNTFLSALPADVITENYKRQVEEAVYSFVNPTVPKQPKIIHTSFDIAAKLGITKEEVTSEDFKNVMSGSTVYKNTKPYAMCYGGHQFGNWAGQLGDGRAINLFEVDHQNKNWKIQLKGAGETPYSRNGDGFAVLRSSVREYLCSEAMYHLGVPTTRALSLALSGDSVLRDMLYDGNAALEKGAIVARVAPSFLRFGNFEIFASRNDTKNLKILTDYTITQHYKNLGKPSKETYIAFFNAVMRNTLDMIIHWQRVGFVHGVMNTDNMSILGLTIDYGPYGWLEGFDFGWTPNTTDRQHKRYRFGNQPNIGLWNLYKLANALYPLIEDAAPLERILESYKTEFEVQSLAMMRSKIGLLETDANDLSLIETLQDNLQLAETDMTIFFRNLSQFKNADSGTTILKTALYNQDSITDAIEKKWLSWFKNYAIRLQKEHLSSKERKQKMDAVNPKYVLRNYMVQLAIDAAEKEDYSIIDSLFTVLQQPYKEQKEHEKWFAKRPEWARHKVGCSMLSCSS